MKSVYILFLIVIFYRYLVAFLSCNGHTDFVDAKKVCLVLKSSRSKTWLAAYYKI